MKYLLTFILTFISFCLSAQAEKNQKELDTVLVSNTIYKLFNDIRLKSDTLKLRIEFDSITQLEFKSYKEKNGQKPDTVSKLVSRNENSFSIRASDTLFEFSSKKSMSHFYGGFYPQINAQLIKVAGAGICEMFLIDQETAIGLSLPGFYDGSCSQPMISPNNNFLMTYGTCQGGDYCFNYYEHISTISIINLKHVNSITELKTFRFIGINDFTIEDIFWIKNNFIVLKVFDEIAYDKYGEDDHQKYISYLKGKIEW